MTTQNNTKILDELIDNATELPLESQDWLLLIAKSMRYTRDYIIKKSGEQCNAQAKTA
ncbi:MAG: hypothetical protein HFG19_00300 [Oscillospiraceae bacterium]|nr:hypothetical protein [Oscillospiraceae bacterium]